MPKRGIPRSKIDLFFNPKFINVIKDLSKARKPGGTLPVAASGFSFDYFSGMGGSGLTKCQSVARMGAVKVRHNGKNTKNTRKSPQIRVFAVIERIADHGRIPLRPDAAAVNPKKINYRIFIEKPREFTEFYRYFRILFFAFFGF